MCQRQLILRFFYAVPDVKSNEVGVKLTKVVALAAILICFRGVIAAETPLTIIDDSLPSLNAGEEFHALCHASGGAPPYLWSVDGELPEGISLSQDGILSGRPAKAGPLVITVILADSSHPRHEVQKTFHATVGASFLLEWLESPRVRDNRIDGSVQVSNGSRDTYDLTVIIVAVAESGRATAIGYERFPLKPGANQVPITFGNTLPHGAYVIHADAIAEIPARQSILRQRLQTPQALPVAAGP
jgi:hypothetical protein